MTKNNEMNPLKGPLLVSTPGQAPAPKNWVLPRGKQRGILILIKIRPAIASDVKTIACILRELGWFEHINKESPAQTEARIIRHLELCNADNSHTILVAENQSGEVAGYIAVHWLPYLVLAGQEGYISELFIHKEERGRGIGTKLIEVVKEQAVKRGCTRLHLLNIRTRPSSARGFYKKLGWTEREETADFIFPL